MAFYVMDEFKRVGLTKFQHTEISSFINIFPP